LDALIGFSFTVFFVLVEATWVAMLQLPVFHLSEGSGQVAQNHPDENLAARLQPVHFSTVSWQLPPLYLHPALVINGQAAPSRIVVQSMGITPFH
jgi:hypothetical protein